MRKERLLLFFVVIAIGLTGCLREGIDTIALPFGKIPEGVIPHEIREQFEEHMPIYEGVTPPNITGEYLNRPDVLVFTSDGLFDPGDEFAPQYFSFQNQTPSGMATFSEKQANIESEASEVYVVGSGNNFSAYFISNSIRHDDAGNVTSTCKLSTVFSGTVTENGIENFRFAFVMLEKDDPNYELMDVNEYRVFKDGDGLAIRYDWLKSSTDGECKLPMYANNKNLKIK